MSDDDDIEVIGTVLHKDIANGCEKFPLEVSNIVNAFNIDINLKYITKCRAKDEGLRAKLNCCDCEPGPNACMTNKCACRKASTVRIKDRKISNISTIMKDAMSKILIECRDECACKRNCQNWITQPQIQVQTALEYFDKKGFGVRLKESASKGQYLGEYTGEVIENWDRDNPLYQFRIDAGRGHQTSFIVDARIFGNLTRYVNHSCDPCLATFLFVRNSVNNKEFPQLGFYFTSDVRAGSELSIDYGDEYWNAVNFDCLCGSPKCRKPLPGKAMNTGKQKRGQSNTSDEQQPTHKKKNYGKAVKSAQKSVLN